MSGLFPKAPHVPVEGKAQIPACEWVVPARRTHRVGICKALPPGMPDYLQVSVEYSIEGTGRCTAAFYGERAYLIHYEFKPAGR